MSLQLPKAIIIDLCGTMLDSLDNDRKIMDEISYSYASVSYKELKLKKDRYLSMRQNFPIFFGELSDVAYSDYVEKLIDGVCDNDLFQGTKDFLTLAKSYGIPVILLSNRGQEYIDAVVKHFSLGKLISIATSAPDVIGYDKPSREAIEGTLNLLHRPDITFSEVVIIGDSLVDVQSAHNVGAASYLFTARMSDSEKREISEQVEEKRIRITYQFSSYEQLSRAWKSQIGFSSTPNNTFQPR